MTIVVQSTSGTSALDLITFAMKLTGEYGAGEDVLNDDAQDGLDALNSMLDSWSNDRLSVYQILKENFTLTPGTGEYTIGSGATFDAARPVKIVDAFVRIDGVDHQLEIIQDVRDYNSISNKSVESIPCRLFYDNAFPLGKIFLYPEPNAANDLYLFSYKQLTNFETLNDEVQLPLGYKRAIQYNLARELNPLFGNAMTEDAKQIAIESLAAIKRINYKPITSKTDIFSGGYYNIVSDTYR